MIRRVFALSLILSLAACSGKQIDISQLPQGSPPGEILLPLQEGSLRFAAVGDTGTGGSKQYENAHMMARYHQLFPFEFVLLLGDNLYGSENPEDYADKFERPYQLLLDRGVDFYASLGNHDEEAQRFYKLFNMGGRRYYTFTKGPARFFALDTGRMNSEQLEWLEKQLQSSQSQWQIAFFHHPLYSSGRRHGPDLVLRKELEPFFLRYGVDVVFAGHEHFYERLKPQKGIYHFIAGAGGKLRKGNIRKTQLTAKGYDQDQSFVLVEINGDRMHFQVINRKGETVDSGVLPQRPAKGSSP